jgi:hypothetical protein
MNAPHSSSPEAANRRLDRPGADRSEHGIERCGELGVPIADQELELRSPFPDVSDQVAGLLGGPRPRRVRRHTQDVDPTRADLHHEEHIQPAQQHGVHVQKVTRQQTTRLGGEELPPGRVRPPAAPGQASRRQGSGPPPRDSRVQTFRPGSDGVPRRDSPQRGGSPTRGPRQRPAVGPAGSGRSSARRSACGATPNSVPGVTSRNRRNPLGSSPAIAARTARSAQSNCGRPACRRSTATSWRKTSTSASLAASLRLSSASQPNTRVIIK